MPSTSRAAVAPLRRKCWESSARRRSADTMELHHVAHAANLTSLTNPIPDLRTRCARNAAYRSRKRSDLARRRCGSAARHAGGMSTTSPGLDDFGSTVADLDRAAPLQNHVAFRDSGESVPPRGYARRRPVARAIDAAASSAEFDSSRMWHRSAVKYSRAGSVRRTPSCIAIHLPSNSRPCLSGSLAQHQHDRRRDEIRNGQRQQARLEAAGVVLRDTPRVRTDERADHADRTDRGNAARGRAAAQERRSE